MADQTPGVSTSFNRDSDVSGTAPNSRLLLFGLVPAGAPANAGVPFLATSLSQVQAQSGAAWRRTTR